MIVFDHPLAPRQSWPVEHDHVSVFGGVFRLDLDAFGAVVCCLALLGWWAYRQCQNRCTDCGYCPIWCQCEREDGRRHRPSR